MKRATAVAAFSVTMAMVTGGGTPAQAEGKNPPGINPTHYQCYRVSEAEPFGRREVKLHDQFGTSAATILKTSLLCAPVDKNEQRARDRQTHYVCYEEEGRAADKKVIVTNQFGKQTLVVDRPALLCVPSMKRLP
jgi:hypothetical protein